MVFSMLSPSIFKQANLLTFNCFSLISWIGVAISSIFCSKNMSLPDNVGAYTFIILSGNPGNGKTHLSVATAKAAVNKCKTALFTTVGDMIDKINDAGWNKAKIIDNYANSKNGSTMLNANFVRIHDASANPGMSYAASTNIVNGTTSGAALNIISTNYELCNEYQAKLIAWQKWYEANQKILNANK